VTWNCRADMKSFRSTPVAMRGGSGLRSLSSQLSWWGCDMVMVTKKQKPIHTTILIYDAPGHNSIGTVEVKRNEDGFIGLTIDNFDGGNRETILLDSMEAEAIALSLSLAIKQLRNGGAG